MELFPATKTGILKKGPSGENLSFADDAQGSLSRNFKSVLSSGTSETRSDELPASQALRSRGGTLQFPQQTGNPAYQARVSYSSHRCTSNGVDAENY